MSTAVVELKSGLSEADSVAFLRDADGDGSLGLKSAERVRQPLFHFVRFLEKWREKARI